MRYFIDTEFIEGPQKTLFGYTKPTIDLISVGIKCEDGREYYAISKDFNLKEAWDRYDVKIESVSGDQRNLFPNGIEKKIYWLRDNVLKPIYSDLINKELDTDIIAELEYPFSYISMKYLIKKYGKSNKQIAEEVKEFCTYSNPKLKGLKIPEFYAYYGDYDWVVFCWLFGRMIDLPKGFPCYAKDLQQIFDDKKGLVKGRMKDQPGFPINKGIHNALEDAKWNFELFKFLNTI